MDTINRSILLLESKLKGNKVQYEQLDEAICTAQFVKQTWVRGLR